ncbi:coiled-coil domain-containing protein 103 isoform X1 [Ambystoma mexicanum]|uniref:coiled-coil domain-containing protein 103 isoform X1 n=1 Tax=Ambystoma mexicanum TaxID=8296 RepID=UPI0037E81971
MEGSDAIDFSALERELQAAVAADEKYQRENDAKFRAVHQKVASYEEFRDIVLASHLRPLERKDKIGGKRNQPWNSCAMPSGPQQNCVGELSQLRVLEILPLWSPKVANHQEFTLEPKTAAEFHRDWRRCLQGATERYQFLMRLGATTLGRIFHADLAFGLLGELLTTLAENIQIADHTVVIQILQSLSTTRRFDLNLDFLSMSEKESCRHLFQKLRGRVHAEVGTDREAEANMQFSHETGQVYDEHVQELDKLMTLYKVT